MPNTCLAYNDGFNRVNIVSFRKQLKSGLRVLSGDTSNGNWALDGTEPGNVFIGSV